MKICTGFWYFNRLTTLTWWKRTTCQTDKTITKHSMTEKHRKTEDFRTAVENRMEQKKYFFPWLELLKCYTICDPASCNSVFKMSFDGNRCYTDRMSVHKFIFMLVFISSFYFGLCEWGKTTTLITIYDGLVQKIQTVML